VLWEILRAHDDLHLRRSCLHRYFKPKDLRDYLLFFRHLVLRALACLPDDRWIALPDLGDLMRALWPRFDDVACGERDYLSRERAWFVASAKGDPLGPDDWPLAQGRFIEQTIAGPLHWLGLADLGFGADGLMAFRLRGLGDLYWDRVEIPTSQAAAARRESTSAPSDAVDIHEYTISVVPSAVPSQMHHVLDEIARLETVTAEQFTYQLDSRSVHESFEAGLTLDEIVADWEKWLPVPMPPAIHDRMADWWKAYGQVRIYEDLAIIEFGDDYALAEAKAVTPLENHLVAEVSPRLIIVQREAVDSLRKALERAGYTPRQADGV
jgi:hypothetical protein